MKMQLPLVALFALSALFGCIVEAPTSAGKQVLGEVQPAGPREMKSGANFGGKAELVSAVFNPVRPTPGEPVQVQLSFRVLGAFDKNYGIFVHVEDADGRGERLNSDHDPSEKPTTQWRVGENIGDVFQFTLPATSQMRSAIVLIGMWDRATDVRVPIVNANTVRTDGQNRLVLGALQVMTPY